MRAATAILIFLAGVTATSAQSAVNRLNRATIFGKEYVSIEDWARVNNFQLRWLARNKELQATNGSARIVFEVNSHKISLNGVNVWLSVPIAAKDGKCAAQVAHVLIESRHLLYG